MIENSKDVGISFRCNNKVSKMIDELKDKLCLNTTSIMIMALVFLYEKEIRQSTNNDGDKNGLL
jgi:hypothetical protein